MSRATEGVEEREIKMAVPDGFVMPALSQLAGVTVVDRGDTLLHAVYWDTGDLGLARAGVGVRHRNGVWAFKGRSRRDGNALVREELELSGEADRLPEPISQRLAEWVVVSEVRPVAELRTVRHTFDVSATSQSAEVVHDRVSVRDGTAERARFKEVEVEYESASAALTDRIVALLASHGATVDTTPKYLRALRLLGYDPPEVSG
jgi:inorganic triphosphatase YgiF